MLWAHELRLLLRQRLTVAALLLLSRFDFAFLAVRGYIDIPYLALVVWAVALEAGRPRRGLPVFALLVLAIANRDPIPRAGSLAVALANVAWVIASVAALVSGALDPTTGGAVWVIAQALVVEAFATVQLYARSGSAR